MTFSRNLCFLNQSLYHLCVNIFFLLLERIEIVYASVVLVPYLSCQKKFNNLRVCVCNCISILCTFGQISQLLFVSESLPINNLVVEQWCSILRNFSPFREQIFYNASFIILKLNSQTLLSISPHNLGKWKSYMML